MVVWSELPYDLLYLIGKKLDIVADRCRFRSVCKSWRCSLPPFAQPPWLMLSEPSQSEGRFNPVSPSSPPPLRGFVGIGGGGGEQQQVVHEIELPEAHQMKCVGSTGTWLITIDLYKGIHLLNPFSRVQIHLPSQSTFEYGLDIFPLRDEDVAPEIHRDCLVDKVILSSTPEFISTSKDCIAMAIHRHGKKLAIARPGDVSWTTVETPKDHYAADIIFFKEQFYVVTIRGVVMVCDISDGLHTPKASVLTERLPQTSIIDETKYLVELRGELLLVIKFVFDPDDINDAEDKLSPYKTEKFQVYKLNFTNKKWEEVNSLGEYCLFLGFNTSIAVQPINYFGLKRNCIYFTDDFMNGYQGREIPGGRDMGVFDLEDKSIQPHYKGESTCYYSPPLWLIPTLPVK
ncbi:hypothetical protein AQUCO_00700762v1 [Aquilegia coerulea]|uniref:Uncharacterized protein n=1 Tax=Aquilegia coerulea TaxID=218851 RepID=A0A2G5ELH8_AQUCA|nr:hypothetical protein AQUCO_00700762v1 [Aquilegia coerulea]